MVINFSNSKFTNYRTGGNRVKAAMFRMKRIIAIFVVAVLSMSLVSCGSDDDEQGFNYPMESLYGTWNGTEIKTEKATIDLTNLFWYEYKFSITFNSDGSYRGKGYFGNGTGTYKAEGDMIYTYVSGEEYARYKVLSFSGDTATLIMYMGDDSIQIKVKKSE